MTVHLGEGHQSHRLWSSEFLNEVFYSENQQIFPDDASLRMDSIYHLHWVHKKQPQADFYQVLARFYFMIIRLKLMALLSSRLLSPLA